MTDAWTRMLAYVRSGAMAEAAGDEDGPTRSTETGTFTGPLSVSITSVAVLVLVWG